MMQLALLLKMKMTTVQGVETSVTVNNNSPIQLHMVTYMVTYGYIFNYVDARVQLQWDKKGTLL